MIENHNLTSLLIPSQLPEHIRDDPSYANFVTFLQAYYEWMEQSGNVTDRTKNLLNYKDVDSSTDEFLSYFYNDFLSYFPKEILADKVELVKLAKELYKSKGTPASYQLLFRILYNMDVDFFYTKDAVLKASNGKWYVTKSLKLSTDLIYVDTISYSGNTITIKTVTGNDLTPNTSFTLSGTTATTNPPDGTWTVSNIVDDHTFIFNATNIPTGTLGAINASVYIPSGFANKDFLDTNNLRIFGETTKSIATIENSVISGKRIEVFISNIERLFESGEYIRIVDTNNQDVLFNGRTLRAKILGQISQVNIKPTNRGLLYQTHDPVIVYGGLNTPTGIGATAEVKETTTGSIQRIKVEYGGYGYTNFNNSGLQGSANTRLNITNATGAQAHVTVLDSFDNPNKVDVSFIPIDYIGLCNNVTIGNTTLSFFANNITANANTSLANSFTFTSFSTYPISSVIVDNGGGGIKQTPVVTADSLYYTKNLAALANLKNLGILAPIQIIDPGFGYAANDKIIFTGGTGYQAYANVTSVNSNGSILTTSFVHDANNKLVSLGGMGYTVGTLIPPPNVANTQILNTLHNTEYKLGSGLPSLSVSSVNGAAANAVLIIPGILGDGALFTPLVDRVGSITTINVSNYGEDYIEAPLVSIKVQDIIVKGLTLDNLPQTGDVVYQEPISVTFTGSIDITGLLTVTAVTSGTILNGMKLSGVGINDGTNIIALTTGTGGIGTYVTNQLLVSASTTITGISYTYVALVDSITMLIPNADTTSSVYMLRVYNYNAKPAFTTPLKVVDKTISMIMTTEYNAILPIDDRRDVYGVLTYGDGTAKATAKFLNGLTIGEGEYLNSTGHPSSFDVIQSTEYNNYTYKITLEKEIDKYRKTLLDLLHPTGMKVIGRYALKSESKSNFKISDNLNIANTLLYYTGSSSSNATMSVPIATNLLTYSNDFSNAAWTKNNATITSAANITPDGTLTASKLVENTGSVWHYIYASRTGSNETVTLSVYAKAGERTGLELRMSNFATQSLGADFDLSTGTVGHIDNGGGDYTSPSTTITNCGDGWYRCSLTVTKAAVNTVNNAQISLRSASDAYTGDGYSGVYIWCAQLETGTVATPYTRTLSTTASSLGAQSTNIVKFNGLGSSNLNNFITTNSSITTTTTQGTGIYSEILSADTSANTITLKDNVWLTFANVAYVTANASSNIINISSLTGQYDIINNGNYSNPAYPLLDIVRVGDNVIVANNMYKTVSAVDYSNNIIYLSANLTNNVNSSMSVNRTLTANAAYVKISKPVN